MPIDPILEAIYILKDFTPFPKNLTIARIFKEIGLADELGSGVRNLLKYGKIYSGKDPVFIEDDIFKIIVPLKEDLSEEFIEDKSSQRTVEKIISAINENPKINYKRIGGNYRAKQKRYRMEYKKTQATG